MPPAFSPIFGLFHDFTPAKPPTRSDVFRFFERTPPSHSSFSNPSAFSPVKKTGPPSVRRTRGPGGSVAAFSLRRGTGKPPPDAERRGADPNLLSRAGRSERLRRLKPARLRPSSGKKREIDRPVKDPGSAGRPALRDESATPQAVFPRERAQAGNPPPRGSESDVAGCWVSRGSGPGR